MLSSRHMGRSDITDNPSLGKTATTDKNVKEVKKNIIFDDRRLTTREIYDILCQGYGTVQRIITESEFLILGFQDC